MKMEHVVPIVTEYIDSSYNEFGFSRLYYIGDVRGPNGTALYYDEPAEIVFDWMEV